MSTWLSAVAIMFKFTDINALIGTRLNASKLNQYGEQLNRSAILSSAKDRTLGYVRTDVISLNRLSLGCVTSPKRQSGGFTGV